MYLTKQGQRAQSPSLARHALASSEALEDHIKVGSFYEVDHSKLPPKSPEQLYSIRVVMVSEKTASNASLRFPSVHSLRTHFSDRNYGKPEAKKLPALDEKYVMGSDMAAEVLFRRVPTQEISEGGNLWSFWASPALVPERNGVTDAVSKKGSCWSELKFTGLVQWGKRRQVRFLNRHDEYKLASRRSSKRKLHGKNSKTQNLKRARSDQKQMQKVNSKSQKKPLKNSIERWSAARYKLAEENMLKIMKAKGAVFGNPILRPALRSEARRLIGDTGLLDHLLKHMAGKVAPGGADRFRRRHNSDGAMEYWIENADLVNIRRQAGVQDPYWTPPPGWKPGDNPTQDPVCASEIKALKEEIVKMKKKNIQELKQLREELTAKMKKDKEELFFKKSVEDLTVVTNPNTKLTTVGQFDPEEFLQQMKKMHEELVNKKAKAEEQLMGFSEYLNKLEEQVRMFNSRGGTLSEPEPLSLIAPPTSPSDSETRERKDMGSKKNKSGDQKGDKPATTEMKEDKAAKIQRLKSGFTICKPHGTFLWPNMATFPPVAAGAVVHPDVLDPDSLVVPTPPSVSSSTTTTTTSAPPPPPQHHHHLNPPSPVKPLAEKRPVRSATLCTVSKLCSSSRSSSLPTPPKSPNSLTLSSSIKTATSLINLNETPDDQNCTDDGICGTLPLRRRPSNLVPSENKREAGAEGEENGMSYYEYEQQQQKMQKECSSTCSLRVAQMGQSNWLALARQDPASNNSKES
ncbi:hypothetical protein TIFTF001_010252 [Ficus carica]|uniref:PTC1-like winged helix-turn-helix domain-containing protein n=1 Tax=Ficus carica TaxID=3494 RepID=A0AA88ABW3_FICCA|nr:hypothetical protein TIFTF001_010252 [Ficus carica]